MKDRIKAVREDMKYSQEKFGEKLGVTKSAISKIEKGERLPSTQLLLAISREYGINEEWLNTGEGDMYLPDDFSYDLGRYAASATDFEKEFITGFMKLSDSTKDEIKNLMLDIAEKLREND